MGGRLLLDKHKSLPQALVTVFPEYNWLPWKFKHSSKNHLEDIKTQRKFVEEIGKELGIKEMEDWYKVTQKVAIATLIKFILKDFFGLGGVTLLRLYSDSPAQLLAAVFPEYNWLPWKFEKAPRNVWQSEINIKKVVEWAGKQLGIKDMDDWYKVSRYEIMRLGCEVPLSELLFIAYPHVKWEFHSKSKANYYKKTQFLLKTMLKSIFPKDGNNKQLLFVGVNL